MFLAYYNYRACARARGLPPVFDCFVLHAHFLLDSFIRLVHHNLAYAVAAHWRNYVPR